MKKPYRDYLIRAHILAFITVLFLSVSITGCYASMSGTVVDAETGKPIEGAVVLVEWTYTSGKWMGLRSTSSYKVVETITDKEGKFKVSDVLNPFVDPPHVTIYKKGYVAWNNEYIFPDYKKREDFQWRSGYVFRLEHFKPEYKYANHTFFIHTAIRLGLGEKKLIINAIDWEESKAFEERQKIKKH